MVKDGTRPERGSPGPVAPALCHPAGAEARHYRGKYYAELARRFPGGFDVALSRDPEAAAMRPPRGTFLVARRDGRPVGCVGLTGGRDGVAEIKRLWVEPSAQGLGLTRRLMATAKAAAHALGLHTPRLDTHSTLAQAVALYRRDGWREIARFNDDPYPELFFERQLARTRPRRCARGGRADPVPARRRKDVHF